MSFIYDKNLLAELIKSAIDHEVKFNKHGQLAADPNVNLEFRNYLTLTKKLADQLEQKYFPSGPGETVVTTGTGKEAQLGVPDLSSLGNFFDFMVNNQIMVDNKRIVYSANEQPPDPRLWKPVTAQQIKFMMETQNEQNERTQFQADYYVNRDLLVKYVNSILRDSSKEDDETQKFIKTMLGARLQDINRIFRTKLTTEYKEPEKVLPDNTVLDNTPKDMDPQTWFNRGNIPLTIGDLKGGTAFNAWLSGNSISIKVDNRQMMINHPEFDRCAIMRILNSRAKYNLDRATSAQAQQVATIYAQRIQALAGELKCDLSDKSSQQQQQQQQGQGQGLSGASPQILQQLSSLRPFNAQYISFPEIKKFIELYTKYANDADVTKTAADLNGYMEAFKSYLGMRGDTFQLTNIDNNRFKSMLKNPSAARQAADLLYDIVVYAGQLYQRLVVSLQTVAQDAERAKYIDYRGMQQQVTPGGPQQTNVTDLNDLRQSLSREWMARR